MLRAREGASYQDAALVVLDGDDSQIKKVALMCLSSQKEWDETWAEHLGTPADDYCRFIVLPKSDKEIVLEENIQRYIGHPPAWKVRARLPRASNSRSE